MRLVPRRTSEIGEAISDPVAPSTEVLIEEVRRRARRRRLRNLALVLLVVAGVVSYLAMSGASPRRINPAAGVSESGLTLATTRHGGISAATLPTGLSFDSIRASSSGIVLGGNPRVGGENGACLVADLVVGNTLGLSHVIEPRCDSPALVAQSLTPEDEGAALNGVEVRIARLEPSGRVVFGPVITSFQQSSSTGVLSVDGPGVIWLYHFGAARGATVYELCASTGNVIDTAAAPELLHPEITADANGLYLGGGTNGGIRDALIFHLAPGAKVFQVVYRTPGQNAQFTGRLGTADAGPSGRSANTRNGSTDKARLEHTHPS